MEHKEVARMPCEPVRIAKYPSKGGKITRIIGIVLIVAGVILIIPVSYTHLPSPRDS